MQLFQDLPITMKAAIAGAVILLLILVLIRQRRAQTGGETKEKAPKVKAAKPTRERGRGRGRGAKADTPKKERGRRGRRGAEEPAVETVTPPPALSAVPLPPAPAVADGMNPGWPGAAEVATQEFDPSVLAPPAADAMAAAQPEATWQQPEGPDPAWQQPAEQYPQQYPAEPDWATQGPAAPAADWNAQEPAQEWPAAEPAFDPAAGWTGDQEGAGGWEATQDAAAWSQQTEQSWNQQDAAAWTDDQHGEWQQPAGEDPAWDQTGAPAMDAAPAFAADEEWSSASWEEPAAEAQGQDAQWAEASWDAPSDGVTGELAAAPEVWEQPGAEAEPSWDTPVAEAPSWAAEEPAAADPAPVADAAWDAPPATTPDAEQPDWSTDTPEAEEVAETAWDAPETDDAPWSAVDEPEPLSWEPIDEPAPMAETPATEPGLTSAEFAPLAENDDAAPAAAPAWTLPEIAETAPAAQAPLAPVPAAPQGVPGLPSPVVIDLAHLVDGGSRVELHIEQDAEGRGLRLSFGTADSPTAPTEVADDSPTELEQPSAAETIDSPQSPDEAEPVLVEAHLQDDADEAADEEVPSAPVEATRPRPDVPFLMGDRRPAAPTQPDHTEWTVPADDDQPTAEVLETETVQVGRPANGSTGEQQDPARILADIRARLAALDARRSGDDLDV